MSVGGLVDRVKITTLGQTEDAMGNLVEGIETVLFNNHHARITVLDGKDQLELFGFTGEKMWKVIANYMSTLTQEGNYFLQLASGAPASVITAGKLYKVCRVKHQRNDSNVFHHTSLVVTLE